MTFRDFVVHVPTSAGSVCAEARSVQNAAMIVIADSGIDETMASDVGKSQYWDAQKMAMFYVRKRRRYNAIRRCLSRST